MQIVKMSYYTKSDLQPKGSIAFQPAMNFAGICFADMQRNICANLMEMMDSTVSFMETTKTSTSRTHKHSGKGDQNNY